MVVGGGIDLGGRGVGVGAMFISPMNESIVLMYLKIPR